MLTKAERERLGSAILCKEMIGWDCEGEKLFPGDKVEVVNTDSVRKRYSGAEYCSVGATGIVQRYIRDWFVSVKFKTPTGYVTIAYVDMHLKKLK